jgi:hypothetical protein
MWGIFKRGSDRKRRNIYLTNGCWFFHLFFTNSAIVKISYDVDLLAVKSTLKELGFSSSLLMDKSTADILSKLLDIDVWEHRGGFSLLFPGDIVYICSLGHIPDRQVLSKEEVLDLYKQGKVKFVMVEVLKLID